MPSYTYSSKFQNGYSDAEYITPFAPGDFTKSDSVDVPSMGNTQGPCCAVFCPTAGTVSVLLQNGNTLVLTAAAGSLTRLDAIARIRATGTSVAQPVPLFTQRA